MKEDERIQHLQDRFGLSKVKVSVIYYKLQRDFTITGIVTGPNYFAKKRALIKALEEEGPGTLRHPFFGKIRV